MSSSTLRIPVLVSLAYVAQLGLFMGLATAFTPMPWAITACVSVLFAALAVIAEIKFTDKLIPQTADTPPKLTLEGRRTVGGLCVIVAAGLLASSFFIGRHTQPGSSQYPFLVVGHGSMVPAKVAPFTEAGAKGTVFSGAESVSVDCQVTGEDSHKWYRLSDRLGWLRDDSVIPEPHTGAGRLPVCPD